MVNLKLTKHEAEFLAKQRKGVLVEAARWTNAKGKPDHPDFWTVMFVRMDDKTTYRLRDEFVKKHPLQWIGKEQTP